MEAATFQRNAQQMLLGKRNNCLLVKDDVGKAKPFTHTLPAENFAFGKGSVFCESAGAGKFKYFITEILEQAIYNIILCLVVFSYRQFSISRGRSQGRKSQKPRHQGLQETKQGCTGGRRD